MLNGGTVRARLDPALFAEVERAAKEDDRTVSDWLRILLRQELRRRYERTQERGPRR